MPCRVSKAGHAQPQECTRLPRQKDGHGSATLHFPGGSTRDHKHDGPATYFIQVHVQPSAAQATTSDLCTRIIPLISASNGGCPPKDWPPSACLGWVGPSTAASSALKLKKGHKVDGDRILNLSADHFASVRTPGMDCAAQGACGSLEGRSQTRQDWSALRALLLRLALLVALLMLSGRPWTLQQAVAHSNGATPHGPVRLADRRLLQSEV